MKYFTVKELQASDTAKRLRIDNTIPNHLISNVVFLIETVLDPLRKAWGSPIKVTSGYRSVELNRAIKGSTTSAHSYGCAADLVPANGKLEEFKKFVFNWLINEHIMFDQYIDEESGKSSWVHIGVKNDKGQQRRQCLLYRNGKYTLIK